MFRLKRNHTIDARKKTCDHHITSDHRVGVRSDQPRILFLFSPQIFGKQESKEKNFTMHEIEHFNLDIHQSIQSAYWAGCQLLLQLSQFYWRNIMRMVLCIFFFCQLQNQWTETQKRKWKNPQNHPTKQRMSLSRSNLHFILLPFVSKPRQTGPFFTRTCHKVAAAVVGVCYEVPLQVINGSCDNRMSPIKPVINLLTRLSVCSSVNRRGSENRKIRISQFSALGTQTHI